MKVFGQFDVRLQPELRLTVSTVDVDMGPRFLTRKEEEPITLFTKDGWTHQLNDSAKRK
jgi:hypothetical protein